MREQEAKQNPSDNRRDGKRGGGKYNRRDGKGRYNDNGPQETTKEDAEKLGINFSRGGPPRFKNDKKKEKEAEQPVVRQVVEVQEEKKDLR